MPMTRLLKNARDKDAIGKSKNGHTMEIGATNIAAKIRQATTAAMLDTKKLYFAANSGNDLPGFSS